MYKKAIKNRGKCKEIQNLCSPQSADKKEHLGGGSGQSVDSCYGNTSFSVCLFSEYADDLRFKHGFSVIE